MLKVIFKRVAFFTFLCLTCCPLLSGCARPFDSYHQPSGIQKAAFAGAVGGVIASAATNASLPALLLGGTALGGAIGATKNNIAFTQLYNEGANVVMIGDHAKILIPSDKLFVFNTARIDSKQFPLLNDVSRFLSYYKQDPITIAAYTDNVLSQKANAKLSFKQANAISAYLWAHGIKNHLLHPVAMASRYPIARNNRVQGRTYNRRIEITVSTQA